MHNTDTKSQFIELRAKGWSLARIAAHLANAGYPALLLDIVLPNEKDRSAAARSTGNTDSCAWNWTAATTAGRPSAAKDKCWTRAPARGRRASRSSA